MNSRPVRLRNVLIEMPSKFERCEAGRAGEAIDSSLKGARIRVLERAYQTERFRQRGYFNVVFRTRPPGRVFSPSGSVMYSVLIAGSHASMCGRMGKFLHIS